jgi:YVTN family beta-propeller protein
MGTGLWSALARRAGCRCGVAFVAAITVAVLAAAPALASAGPIAYVTDPGAGTVIPIATATNVAGTAITVGAHPTAVAITPDGKTAYVTNPVSGICNKITHVCKYSDGSVTPIATATNTAGTPITVGVSPSGIAITPEGKTANVTNQGDGTKPGSVTPIATATNIAGTPITVGTDPAAVAVTPDGQTAYVVNQGDGTDPGSVTPIATATNTAGTPITVGVSPSGIAITPDGKTAYVVNYGDGTDPGSVTPVATATNTAGTPITVGVSPSGIAITPDGKTAYVTNQGDGTDPGSVTPIATATNTAGTPITVGVSPSGIAITPDGKTAYVANNGSGSVTPIATATNTAGVAIAAGVAPNGVAVVPDLAPTAAFTAGSATAGQATNFDASASSASDGTVADYQWSFGDSQTATTTSPTTSHTYATAGAYTTTLTVTDNDGCSTTQIFTGQTMSCNGSSSAQVQEQIVVSPPPIPVNTTLPAITGTAKVGQMLTVDTTGAFTGPNVTYSYQWQDCNSGTCTNVANGGTSSSYTLAAGDVGDTIDVVVTATNDGGSSAATSLQTTAVAALPNPTPTPPSTTPTPTPTPAPVSTAAPVISGTVAVGHVLSVSTGSWSGTTTGFQYQWLRDGVPISGSTHSSYTVQTADQGHALTCTVTAADGSSTSTSTSSSTSSGVTIPISNVKACPQPTSQLSGTTLGPITLGLTRTRARRMLPRFNTPSYHTDNFCLSGGSGIRVGYASAKLLGSSDARQAAISGTVVLALTANPFYALDGVKPGARLASAAHRLKLGKVIRLGLNDWYVIPAATSNGVLKVRHGIVQEVGVANKGLTATRAAQARLLRSF